MPKVWICRSVLRVLCTLPLGRLVTAYVKRAAGQERLRKTGDRMASSVAHMPDNPLALPPAFTLPHWIDPADGPAVLAFMDSCAAAWQECVKQRRLSGCCEVCGTLILDPQFGCDNVFDDCPMALRALARREAIRR